jgi:hypothetical protein
MEAEDEKKFPSRAQAGTVYPNLPTTLRARSRIALCVPKIRFGVDRVPRR